jgi:esterase/lipase
VEKPFIKANQEEINQQLYGWCVRAFEQVRKVIGLQIKMHHQRHQLESGEIFLFNHFARVETFIPQYLIHQETGQLCRSIASSEFFEQDDRFALLLRALGVVPNNHPRLMALLAKDLLLGRKVVVFPEGGMVKNRQVVDERGNYSVFSRHAHERRKHHTGAARLAIGLQIFRYAVLDRFARDDFSTLESWCADLGISNVDQLLVAARRPTNLVPANITFYPLRISDNVLSRWVELLKPRLSKRTVEELVVEGNLLLKATDMDISLGVNLEVHKELTWVERRAMQYLAHRLPSLAAIFDSEYLQKKLLTRLATRKMQVAINRLRDSYMRAIYQTTVVNLSHLASSMMMDLAKSGVMRFGESDFRLALYLSIKKLQTNPAICLHQGLRDPTCYSSLLNAPSSGLSQFYDSAESASLIQLEGNALLLKEKLFQTQDFDEVRLENPVEVYANEIKPIVAVHAAIHHALSRSTKIQPAELSLEYFDDELKSLAWDRAQYQQPEHSAINDIETANADSSPFLLRPSQKSSLGVLLVHGFLASPAELREFGIKLLAKGYTVMGVRLKGHGTSPWDLRARSWHDWLASVSRGIEILSNLTPRIALVGFSTGGSLSLISASRLQKNIAGVAAICTPLKFRNKNLRFVPFMHGVNRITNWLSNYEGLMPFGLNESEHPLINYRNIPLRGLYELKCVVNHLEEVLPSISCPVTLIQADGDQIVDPESANILVRNIGSVNKQVHWIPSTRHGILNEDTGETQNIIMDFLAQVDHEKASP